MALISLIKRELVSQLRRVKTLMFLFMLITPIMLFTIEMWPDTGNMVWARVGQDSKGFVMMIVMILFFGAALFMPGVAATTLVIERETNSWDLLILSLIGPWKIIIGKFLSTTGVFLLFMVGIAPFLCVVFFMIGIDIVQLSIGFYIVILTVLTCASLGMLSSAYSRTTTHAISRSYGFMVLNMGLGYVAVLAIYALFIVATQGLYAFSTIGNQGAWVTPAYSTLSMMMAVVQSMMMPMGSMNQYLLDHTIMQVTTICIALFLTWRKVRKPVKPPVAKKRKLGRGAVPETAGGQPLPPGFKPVPQRMNPIMFREIHWGIDIKRRIYFGVIIITFFISGVLAIFHFEQASSVPIEVILTTILSINFALVSFVSLSNLASIFTKDDELKSLDMLKMTLMTPANIVNGKLRAGFRVVNRLVLVSFGINIWFLMPTVFDHSGYQWTYRDSVFVFFTGHAMLWLCGILCVLIACLSSVLCKRRTSSSMLSYGLAGMLYFGLIWLTWIVWLWKDVNGYGEERPWEFLYSPLFGYLKAIEIWRKTDDISFFVVTFALYSFVALILGVLVHAGYNRKKYGIRKAAA